MREIRSQAEADAAIAAGETELDIYADVKIIIDGDTQLTIVVRGAARVTAESHDSSNLRAESHDSSNLTAESFDSSNLRAESFGSSNIRAESFGSSNLTAESHGWSNLTAESFDSSNVRAVSFGWSNLRVNAHDWSMLSVMGPAKVMATAQVRIRIDGGNPEIEGGIVHRVILPKTAAEWCAAYEVAVENGTAILYKAVSDSFQSGWGFGYTPGTVPVAPDWDGGKEECGGGLHFCATPGRARGYFVNATRYVACPVALADTVVHENAKYPDKIKARGCCGPVWECDREGKRIEAAAGPQAEERGDT